MKKYVSPEIEKVMILTADIVTVSNGGDISNISNDVLPGADVQDLF